MTVTRPVALPLTLLALALGGLGAPLGLDGLPFLDRPDSDDDDIDRGAGIRQLLDEAGDAHCSPSLGRNCTSVSRYERGFAQHRKGVGALAAWVDSYGMRVGVMKRGA